MHKVSLLNKEDTIMQKTYIIPATAIQFIQVNTVLCASGGAAPQETIGVASGTKGDFIGD